MNNGVMKKCGNCNVLFDNLWVKHDDKNNHVCPYCGAINNFSDDVEKVNEEKELNEIYILLDNNQFVAATDKLRVLKEKYPKSSKAYFLSVLADNCVCYTKDDSRPKYYIPTLNDLPTSSLAESVNAKKALELAPTELVRESYQEVFDYIEKIRLEILEASKSKENQYDIFISTKVILLDENGHEIKDGMGRPMESPDCAFARDIYNELREQYPGKKIFFSQSSEAKEKMAGQKYENVIYSALHSAKAFILVAESRENIDWRWVRNEWMRYLRIMDRDQNKQHHFVLATHKLSNVDLPRELQGFQYIDFDSISSYRQLNNFISRVFSADQKQTKLVAKTFESDIDKIDFGDVGEDIVTKKLKTKAEEVSDDLKAEIECYERDLDPNSPYRREEAFHNLEDLLSREPNAYDAKKLLLLRDTNYYHFEDYFSNIDEILKNPDLANRFFEFASEDDAKNTIRLIASCLSDSNYYFGYSKENARSKDNVASWSEKLKITLSSLIIPYLDSIDSKDLEKLSKHIFILITDFFDYETDSQTLIVEEYLKLRRYLDGKDAKLYIKARKDILSSLSRCYSDNHLRCKDIQNKLVDEIFKVNPLECDTIWLDFCYKKIKRSCSPRDFIKDLDLKNINLSIIGDKESFACFKSLFKYSSKEDRKLYTLLLLTLIINDQKSYEKEPGQETLLLTKDENEDGQIDDYELNGLDLFMKYIPYELPDIVFESTYSKPLNQDSPLLAPNASAYLKKEKPTPIDKLICEFACRMHRNRFYDQAINLYDLYLGQQESIKTLDSILIRYYKELATVRIFSPNELRKINRPLQHRLIDIDLIQLEKKTEQATVIYNKIKTVIDEQSEYSHTYQPIKDLLNQLPRENTVDKIPLIIDIYNKINSELNQVSNKSVRNELENDFAFELDFFNSKLPQIKSAKTEIDLIEQPDLLKKHLTGYYIQLGMLDFDGFQKNKQELVDIVKSYDDPSLVESHINSINTVSDEIINNYCAFIKAKENKKLSSRFIRCLKYLLAIAPAILSVVLGIILFVNKNQINILYGNNAFIGWSTAWLLMLVPSFIFAIVFVVCRVKGILDSTDKGANIMVVITSTMALVMSLVGFIGAANLDPNFNPPANIVLLFTNVNNKTSGDYYISTISFLIENHNSTTVTYVGGEMELYDYHSLLCKWTVYFSGNYLSNKSYRTSVEFKTTDPSIYHTPFHNLKITYKITEMVFGSSYETFTFDGNFVSVPRID